MLLFSITPSTKATMVALMLELAAIAFAGPVALPGCPEACGNVTVPYPFGIGQGCSRAGFNLTCDETRRPPKLLLGTMEVVDISLGDGTMRIRSNMTYVSASQNTGAVQPTGNWSVGQWRVVVSTTHNRFMAIGCNVLASLVAGPDHCVSVCAALCPSTGQEPDDGACSGVGCCQAPIAPQGLASYGIQLTALGAIGSYSTSLGYGGVFIADQEWFAREWPVLRTIYHSQAEPQMFINSTAITTVLEWWFDLDSDRDILRQEGCTSANSIAFDVADGGTPGRRRCNCSKGYEGNPYIPNGCQDINECQQPGVYPCSGSCTNMLGTYRCSAKKSITSLPAFITAIAISAGFGLLFSLLSVAKITKRLKQRRAKKLRQAFFKRNNKLLLQALNSSDNDRTERMKIFSLEELQQASNKFDENRILGGGGHGTVYKGILSDQRVVAIKKSKIIVQREIDQFVNEIAILSQTIHRNVVKLLGCCLETEVPLLVYEFISNGTLSYHLHGQNMNPLPWKDRLRIALETARAIAYLHSAASISIFHRDIKCANILLTDTLTTKVSDFGASRSISIDETGILTAVQGTHGYLDPEYYYTGRLTEKSDVYSFGVILAELLTRMTHVFSSETSEVTSLASYFVSIVRENRFLDILDKHIVEEGGAEDAEVVAKLAKTCLSLKGEERPTMRQVETLLEDVHRSKVQINSDARSTSLNDINEQSYMGGKPGEGTRLYSLEKEYIQSSEIPR